METVGIRELKNRLSAYVQLTKSRHTVIITEKGKPVALLKPLGPGDHPESETVEHRLALLANRGLIRLPLSKIREVPEPIALSGGELVSTAILER